MQYPFKVFYETVGGNLTADLFCSAFVRSAVHIILSFNRPVDKDGR